MARAVCISAYRYTQLSWILPWLCLVLTGFS
jgi:hypothetical protein